MFKTHRWTMKYLFRPHRSYYTELWLVVQCLFLSSTWLITQKYWFGTICDTCDHLWLELTSCSQPPSLTMTPTIPFAILKTGLAALNSKAEIRKNDLLNRLKAQEKISAAGETWLDQEGNYVDKEALLNTLGAASNFEHALTLLNPGEKKVLDGLIEMGKGGMSTSSSGQGRICWRNTSVHAFAIHLCIVLTLL